VLAQTLVVPQCLRRHTPDHPLALGDDIVQLFIAADIELLEPLEEFSQVVDRTVPELCKVQDYAQYRR
jgi:hypothetical protein